MAISQKYILAMVLPGGAVTASLGSEELGRIKQYGPGGGLRYWQKILHA
jgi:hypothetical protein